MTDYITSIRKSQSLLDDGYTLSFSHFVGHALLSKEGASYRIAPRLMDKLIERHHLVGTETRHGKFFTTTYEAK